MQSLRSHRTQDPICGLAWERHLATPPVNHRHAVTPAFVDPPIMDAVETDGSGVGSGDYSQRSASPADTITRFTG